MTGSPLRLATSAMGTRFELALVEGYGDLRAAGEEAIDEIEGWHRRLSRFAGDSLLSHINRTAACSPVHLDRETFALFEDALQVWRASAGAFDITVPPAMAQPRIADSAVSARGGRAGRSAVVLDARAWTISFRRADAALDLGGIAKGHALDCAAAVLRSAGVTTALIHGGTSSVVGIGAPADRAGWRIAVGPGPDAPLVSLRDAAMSVSDAASQCVNSAVAGHIIDPRTGHAPCGVHRAAVIGPSARLADAWSTALVVLQRIPPGFPPEYQALLGTSPESRARSLDRQ